MAQGTPQRGCDTWGAYVNEETAEELQQTAIAYLAEQEAIAQAEEAYWLRNARARERKLWKARNRMPMHGKHLLRDNRRRHRRRSEHILEE